MRSLALTAIAASLLAACARTEPPAPPPPPPPPAPAVDPSSPLAAPMFMQMAASSDQFEIRSSQLALQRSNNPAIRAYAQMMIDHHTRTTATLAQAAQSAGLTPPPPMLMANHEQMLQQLQATPPESFDMAYRDMQVMSHQQALDLMRNYANGGDNATLRTVAAQTTPIIQDHLTQAQNMQLAPPPPARRAGERG